MKEGTDAPKTVKLTIDTSQNLNFDHSMTNYSGKATAKSLSR